MTVRVTLITGASSGIGGELARIFAANGHKVALVARREDRLKQLADELVSAGHAPPLIISCDLEQHDAGGDCERDQKTSPDFLSSISFAYLTEGYIALKSDHKNP